MFHNQELREKVKIYTGYFARHQSYENPVSIARKTPNWAKVPSYIPLAPDWSIIKIQDPSIYTEKYYETVLNKLDPRKVVLDLLQRHGNNVTLLCYEKPTDFCHRQIVAKWLSESLGIEVIEHK